ncbi:hypothetical protein OCU04_007758 [Sclerotinia nivalis]|uniref:Uncharacterized protein n=1 Tax=Sclerotinia nivalis TaxID=352851 RepID=A0A9X0AKE9_9HELO|nr:hypothetical protein OCU04_007758 [Sclerotinia nivalis]
MKTNILVTIVSAALLVAHSATAKATADNEAQSSLHRHGQTLSTYGNSLNSEDTSSALKVISPLFQSKAGKSLSQFPCGRHVNRLVYAHNTTQVYICGWGIGKVTPIRSEDIVGSFSMISKGWVDTNSSTGEIWFPDLDYSIGFGRVNEVICEPKNLRHKWGRMVGLV